MVKMEFTEDEINELYHEFMAHPAGATKKKLHVVYLKSLNLSHQDIALIARVDADTVTRYLHEYNEGGLTAISIVRTYKPSSKLLPHKKEIKLLFQSTPPHTVSEAVFEIEQLTGIKLGLSVCREFMHKHLGMKCRKMAAIPSKADPERQDVFLEQELKPLLDEEKKEKGFVFFVDAAHFVMGAFLGMIWCFKRLFLRSSSGRKRYNVLGAYSNRDTSLITITNEDYVNSDTIVELLIKINNVHPDSKVTLVMDNARYQRCNKVMDKAKDLGIHLLFLPPYSPNLNLIERLWKFTKKKCLYNKYYESFHHFKEAINDCLDNVKTTFKEQIITLLNPKFQMFSKSATVTA